MHSDLKAAIDSTLRVFRLNSKLIHRESWQAVNVTKKPEMATHELIGHTIEAHLASRDLDYYRSQIAPDIPWADDHFAERVSGKPLNPPPSEAYWPWAPKGNAQFKTEVGGKFSHTYPERFWCRLNRRHRPRRGIRYEYGDLDSVLELLREEPFTRQAYLPVWHPEDTGNRMKQRTPCTLGYHFLRTGMNEEMDVFYYIRSCDLMRHFRNDVYFAIRLLLWVMDNVAKDGEKPGALHMYISSLHCFRNDFFQLFGEYR